MASALKQKVWGIGIYTPPIPARTLEKVCKTAPIKIDLANPVGNKRNSGFLPEERAWMDQVFDEVGYVDVYRRLHPETTGECYTWWSNRGQARAKNVGWRIDYHIATPGIAATARSAAIYKESWFSDHAPLTIVYDWPF